MGVPNVSCLQQRIFNPPPSSPDSRATCFDSFDVLSPRNRGLAGTVESRFNATYVTIIKHVEVNNKHVLLFFKGKN